MIGVAYTRPPHHNKIRHISWDEEAGEAAYKGITKMPTVLRYKAYSSRWGGDLISWGFRASEDSDTVTEGEHIRIVEWFKPYLNSDYLKAANRASSTFLPKSNSEVRRWYVDYLRKLYEKVQWEILKEEVVRPWEALQIEFRFTWPSTWTAADIESFRDCIIAAGFQNDNRPHRVALSFSEAQAAALYAADQIVGKVKDGDTIMVCDVGGGTTDIAVVRVITDPSNTVRFEVEQVCQGRATGATDIDAAFQVFVQR